MDAHVEVLHRIARAIIGAHAPTDAQLGDVQLRPHQLEAVRRLQTAIQSHGGALLADAPGLGKTYVALAVAHRLGDALVVAPAALREQWMRSAAYAGVRIEWCSVESLSRRPVESRAPLLIVDEAHHLRNPLTARYRHAAALAIGKRVLLVTATPVHNRRADRDALFALFLGAAAPALPARVLSQIVVRREADAALMPRRDALRWLRVCVDGTHAVGDDAGVAISSTASIAAALRTLPPPLPAADGRAALALLKLIFAHAWSSSLAAFDATLRRSIHHTAAIADALAANRWPTRHELRAWVTSPESSQLAFAELVAAPASGDIAQARQALDAHRQRLVALRRVVADSCADDAMARARVLRRVLRRHPHATVIAFSRYASTVEALWRALRFDVGIAAITARGVQSAGGGLRRRDVLAALASTAHRDPRLPLRLVLSTDLLGEGLDLRAASVVVHLDQPWTPARLEQREGRAMRLGAAHASAAVYAVRPPRGAERLLTLATRLRGKRAAMHTSLADGTAREQLLHVVRPWAINEPSGARGADADYAAPRGAPTRVAAVRAAINGWVAVVYEERDQMRVIACVDNTITEDDARLAAVLLAVSNAEPLTINRRDVLTARRALRAWLRADASASLAGARQGDAAMRRVIARRLDDALRATSLTRRAELQARIASAHARLATVRGAGVERALAAAALSGTAHALLDAIERIGHGANAAGPVTRPSRLLALLLLVRNA